MLKRYVDDLISQSEPFSYTVICNRQMLGKEHVSFKITKGWLYDQMWKIKYLPKDFTHSGSCDEFYMMYSIITPLHMILK